MRYFTVVLTPLLAILFLIGCSGGNNDLVFPAQPMTEIVIDGQPPVSVVSGHTVDLNSGDVIRPPTATTARRLPSGELIDISPGIYNFRLEDGRLTVAEVLEPTGDGGYRVRDGVPATSWACRVYASPLIASPEWGIALVGVNINMPR